MLESLKVETPAKEKSFDFQHDYAFLKTTRGQDECLIVANMGFGEPRRLFWKESEPDGGWKASLDEATIFNEKGAALARTKTVPKPEGAVKHTEISVSDVMLEEVLPGVGYSVHGSYNKPIFANPEDITYIDRHIFGEIGEFEKIKEIAASKSMKRIVVVEKASKKKHVFYFSDMKENPPPKGPKLAEPVAVRVMQPAFAGIKGRPGFSPIQPRADDLAKPAAQVVAAPVGSLKNDELGRFKVLAAALHAFRGLDVEPTFDAARGVWAVMAETSDKKISISFDAIPADPGILKTGVAFLKRA